MPVVDVKLLPERFFLFFFFGLPTQVEMRAFKVKSEMCQYRALLAERAHANMSAALESRWVPDQ